MTDCYEVMVDGQPVRIQGGQPQTPEGLRAIEEVIRAARKQMEGLPPSPITVDCPECGAPAGRFCRTPMGRLGSVHMERRALVGDAS